MKQIKIYNSLTILSSLTATGQADLSEAQADTPYTLNVVALDPQFDLLGEAVETAGGNLLSAKGVRGGLTARSTPFYYGTGYAGTSYGDGTGYAGLIDKLFGASSGYHYLQFLNYTQAHLFVSNASTKVYAVSVTGIEVEHNHEFGYKIVTISFGGYKFK